MSKKPKPLQELADTLVSEVIKYGIQTISVGQYRTTCNSIIRFAQSKGTDDYSAELLSAYEDHLVQLVSAGEMCPEYKRFQHRVIRMLASLAETGEADFSSAHSKVLKYPVSEDLAELTEKILDYYPISDDTKKDLRAPLRHFLWYAETKEIKPEFIDDSLVIDFIINEIHVSNSGSTGRTLRCVKYATEYLKMNGNKTILRDYTQLKLKNDHRRIIPAYSEAEIRDIVNAAESETILGKRDSAILQIAYCTGFRGVDVIGIRLEDIDWQNHKVSVIQSKTHVPLTAELNGSTMNALADYILDYRPSCDVSEVFVTVKAPYRALNKGFGAMIDKYCKIADVTKIPFRGFHSVRRSFETVMVSRGVSIETASQMMGHKSVSEDKPYLTYNTNQISFVAMDFSDVPIKRGFYAGFFATRPPGKGGDV